MECAEIFKEHFGLEAVIGTQPEFKNGKYTGRTVPPAISGIAKVGKINELVKSRGWDVDWAASYAYGDSITEPNVEPVGNPVAVPGWQITCTCEGRTGKFWERRRNNTAPLGGWAYSTKQSPTRLNA
jgi:hypothetical protein